VPSAVPVFIGHTGERRYGWHDRPMTAAVFTSFLYAFLSAFVILRLGRSPGARGREERLLICLGWCLVGLSAGFFLVLMTIAAASLAT
jgi:hypothetical protein